MKALVLKEYNKFSYEDVPDPEYGKKDILVKVKACAICGSDIHGMDGSTGRRIPPIIMGHEASGIIEKTGDEVSGFKVGERITFDSTVYCGDCYFCRRGDVNLCDYRKVLGVSCQDYRMNGAFAEYVVIPERIAYHMPSNISFEQAAMVEPLSIAFHAIKRASAVLNSNAVVIGSGMIGLLIIQLLKISGIKNVIAVDVVDQKLDMAREFGADHAVNSTKSNAAEDIFKITNNLGADIAFEVVGISESLSTAAASVRKGGTLVLVGNLKATVEFPLQSIVTRQISLYASCASALEYVDCMDLIAAGKVDIDSFISAKAPLSEGASWFQKLYDGDPSLMKVILNP